MGNDLFSSYLKSLMVQYNLHDLNEFAQFFASHPDVWSEFSTRFANDSRLLQYSNAVQAYQSLNNVGNGGDPNDVYKAFSNAGMEPSAELEKYLDNAIAQSNTQQGQQFEEHMRDTSLTSSGSQLESLGLSPSGVIQVGGASSGVSGLSANNSLHSVAGLHQQQRINEYNQKMSMARAIIGMSGQLASSGIYGRALGAAKHSARVLSASAAHSGLVIAKHWNGFGNKEKYKTTKNGLLDLNQQL